MRASNVDLSRALEQVIGEYRADRYSGPGNPLQAQILRRGTVLATKVPFAPQSPMFNQVNGLEDPADLAEVLEFYRATDQNCWINVPPYCSADLTRALVRAGFAPQSSAAVMWVEPVPECGSPSGNPAVDWIDRKDRDLFLDTMNVGFGMPAAQLENVRRNQSFWCDVPTWHLFLARVDGVPAGAAVLSIHDDVGYLAAGCVLPAFRGRGLQTALIAARLKRAAARRCTVVCGGAAWGSQSQRNQQRAGLSIAHVKTIWTNCPVPSAERSR
jgi:GNAT superfamily N-acetyltransferase